MSEFNLIDNFALKLLQEGFTEEEIDFILIALNEAFTETEQNPNKKIKKTDEATQVCSPEV